MPYCAPEPPPWARVAAGLIADRGLTRAEVAAALGLSRRALRDRLAGRVRPYTGELSALAGLLGVPATDLLAGADGPPPAGRLTDRDVRTYEAMEAVAPGDRFPTLAATATFVDSVVGSPWWRGQQTGVAVVRVLGAPRESPAWHSVEPGADGPVAVLHLPAWSRRPLVVLHELAHVAARPLLSVKAHGPQFARLWVDLVDGFMGPAAGRALRAALRSRRLGLAPRPQLAAARRRGAAAMSRLTTGSERDLTVGSPGVGVRPPG